MFVRTLDFQQQRELRLWPLIEQLNPDNLLIHDPAYYRKNSVVDLDEGVFLWHSLNICRQRAQRCNCHCCGAQVLVVKNRRDLFIQ